MGTFNKKLKAILLLMGAVLFTIPICATTYEDAEDNTTTGWVIYDDTSDATIENVEDEERGSRVIKLIGNGRNTGFRLGNRAGRVSYVGAWHNQTEKVLKWSMKYDEPFRIYIPIKTEHGNRYLTYTNQSVDKKGKIRGGKVNHGLGEDSINGEWHTYTRDLEADWNAFMSDDPFVAVNGFFIKGSGYVDDIMALDSLNPPTDTTKPIITLLGDENVTLTVGDTYTDAGATATDDVDGNITTDIQTYSTVDTSIEGNYTVTYDVSDSSGNDADTVTRMVMVTNNTVNLEDGLVAHYEFEGNANDSSGNGNDGTAHGGVSYVHGVIGQAGSFDGVDDYIHVNLNEQLKFNPNKKSFTLSLWAKPESFVDRDGGCTLYAIPFIDSYTYYLTNREIEAKRSYPHQGGARMDYYLWDTTNWHLFSGTWKIVNNKIFATYYIDGKKSAEKELAVIPNGSYAWNGLYFGRTHHCSYSYNYGKFIGDDVRIYNRALNEAEIEELYKIGNKETNTSKIKKTGQTISYYPKDDGDYQKGVTPSYTRDDATEIVTDNITKLQWQDDDDVKTVKRTWQDGKDYCSNTLTLGGYSDWRLPTRKELRGIVDYGHNNPSIDSEFENTNSFLYWSATSYADNSDVAWAIAFSNANQYGSYKINSIYLRCVRTGQ